MNQINPLIAYQANLQKMGNELWRLADEEAIDKLDLQSENIESLKKDIGKEAKEVIL